MQIVCWAHDHRNYQRGDVCFIADDGAELGRDVDPATAPSSSPYVVLQLPNNNSNRKRLRYLLQNYIDPLMPWTISLRPGHPDGDHRSPNIAAPRRYHIDSELLPTNRRSSWRAQRRIDLTGEAQFEFAVRDRANGDQPVNRGNLPRS